MVAYLPSRANFSSDEELIEWLAERVAAVMICPPDTSAAERLEAMRTSVKSLLKYPYKVAPPSDAFLDELLTEMCEWNDRPLDKPETWPG